MQCSVVHATSGRIPYINTIRLSITTHTFMYNRRHQDKHMCSPTCVKYLHEHMEMLEKVRCSCSPTCVKYLHEHMEMLEKARCSCSPTCVKYLHEHMEMLEKIRCSCSPTQV